MKAASAEASLVQAVIFDFDGSMADTERDGHRVAYNLAFTEAGLPWVWDVETYGQLLRFRSGQARLAEYSALHPMPDAEPLDASQIAALHAAKTRIFGDLVSRGSVPLRPGVERLISECRSRGVKLAIVSGTSRSNVESLIAGTMGKSALAGFAVVVTGNNEFAKKPDPAGYVHALAQLEIAPDRCVAIEDSYAGVRSAFEAGVPALITSNAYTRVENFSGAMAILSDLGEPGQPYHQFYGTRLHQGYVTLSSLQQWRRTHSRPSMSDLEAMGKFLG